MKSREFLAIYQNPDNNNLEMLFLPEEELEYFETFQEASEKVCQKIIQGYKREHLERIIKTGITLFEIKNKVVITRNLEKWKAVIYENDGK